MSSIRAYPSDIQEIEPIAEGLAANEEQITSELIDVQGQPMDVGGYYQPDPALAAKAMRPSATFNAIIDGVTVAT